MPHLVTTACAVTLAFSSLIGCSAGETPSVATTSSAPTPPATSAAATSPTVPPAASKPWVDLQVGECVAGVPAVDVGEATVNVVDCATPHGAEVYLLAPVAVNAAITGVADQVCAAGIDRYTGGRAGLSVTYLIDSKQDRTGAIPLPSTVICLLQADGGAPLTGSVRS